MVVVAEPAVAAPPDAVDADLVEPLGSSIGVCPSKSCSMSAIPALLPVASFSLEFVALLCFFWLSLKEPMKEFETGLAGVETSDFL